jgi:formate C-acetyltransferase
MTAPAATRADFAPGRWTDHIDVRDFIQRNVTPYLGDAEFLAGPTERTRGVWDRMSALMAEERATPGGVLDVDVATPSSITSHAPGYIDRDRELIVGLQTGPACCWWICTPPRRSSARSCPTAAIGWSRTA